MIWDDAMGRKPWVHSRGSTSEVTSEAKFGTRSFRAMETLVWRRVTDRVGGGYEIPKVRLQKPRLLVGKPLIDTSIKITQCKEIWFLHFFHTQTYCNSSWCMTLAAIFYLLSPFHNLANASSFQTTTKSARGHRRSFKGSTWRLHPPFDVTWWQLYDSVKWTFSQTGSNQVLEYSLHFYRMNEKPRSYK